jgi:hypothetical protein
MQVKQTLHTVMAVQRPQRARATGDAEAREQPAPGGPASGLVRRVLVWSALTLVAVLALAMATILAGSAAAPADPAPPKPPMQFGPSMGHARPE